MCDAQKHYPGTTSKWLDLTGLCRSYLPVIGRLRGEAAALERIFYFSASPAHRSQAKQDRHALYMRCLLGTGVHVSLGQFKRRNGEGDRRGYRDETL